MGQGAHHPSAMKSDRIGAGHPAAPRHPSLRQSDLAAIHQPSSAGSTIKHQPSSERRRTSSPAWRTPIRVTGQIGVPDHPFDRAVRCFLSFSCPHNPGARSEDPQIAPEEAG